jgi:hypothetical protein
MRIIEIELGIEINNVLFINAKILYIIAMLHGSYDAMLNKIEKIKFSTKYDIHRYAYYYSNTSNFI